MAISGCYCGQLFGILMGFGISQLKNTLVNGPATFSLFDTKNVTNQTLLLLVLGVCFAVFMYSFLFGLVGKCQRASDEKKEKNNEKEYKYNMNKTWAYVTVIMYVGFIIATTALSVYQAIIDF